MIDCCLSTSDLSGSKSSRLSPYGLISLSPCGLAVHMMTTHTMNDKSERRTLSGMLNFAGKLIQSLSLRIKKFNISLHEFVVVDI
jgi:hypothetical protein